MTAADVIYLTLPFAFLFALCVLYGIGKAIAWLIGVEWR